MTTLDRLPRNENEVFQSLNASGAKFIAELAAREHKDMTPAAVALLQLQGAVLIRNRGDFDSNLQTVHQLVQKLPADQENDKLRKQFASLEELAEQYWSLRNGPPQTGLHSQTRDV